MKRVIHHIRKMRNRPEEERRHILHISIIVIGIIMIILWSFSLGKTITNKDTRTKVKQDLKPLQVFKDNMVGSFNEMTGN